VQPETAKITRTCAYDRAGFGWSDPGPQPRDAQQIAAELHALLHNAQIPEPYVLVGWSYGGLYVRVYASQYPQETAGLVLLDSSSPDQCGSSPAWVAQCAATARFNALAPVLARFGVIRLFGLFQPATGLPDPQNRTLLASYSAAKAWDAQQAEALATEATSAQAASVKTLGDLPLIVLTATEHGAPAEMEQGWQAMQSGFTTLSTDSVQRVVPGATHESLVFEAKDAQITVKAILQVVEAARAGKRLKQ
jgi:pimeloyl-ACP methyl ester carboxylesterase